MKKKFDLEKFFDKFGSRVKIYNGAEPKYDGDKPEKQSLYFGCNYEDIPTVVIQWSDKGRGFGEYVFRLKDGIMYCDSECDSPDEVKRILCMMVDQCEFTDYHRKE